MHETLRTTDGYAAPDAGRAALALALILERYGGALSASALDSDGHASAPESNPSPASTRHRRRYRGWSLASGRRQ